MAEESDKAFASVGKTVIALPIAFAILVPLMLLEGWVLSLLWGWLIVPTFDVMALTVIQAIGVVVVFRLVQLDPYRPPKKKDEDVIEAWKKSGKAILLRFLRCFFFLACGLCVKLLM
jgi:hypothetical protein